MPQVASTPRRRVERAMALSAGPPVAQTDGARTCANPSCSTRLSRYNPNPCCAAHGGWTDEQTPKLGRSG